MQFGIFDHLDRSGQGLAAQYEDRLTLLEACDAAGFRAYHLAEHHGTPLGMAPSPALFLAAAAQRTKAIRLGALVFTLSLYHPLRLLEEICMLDALTRGRLDLGIGRGISPIELGFFGVDPAEAQARYVEAYEILMLGLSSDSITYEGKYFRFQDVPVELKPTQRPAPPLWYGLSRPDSAAWAARNGCNIVCNGVPETAAAITGAFKSEWQAAGKGAPMPLLGLARHVLLADTDAEAQALARPAYRQWYDALLHLWLKNNLKIPASFPDNFDAANAAGLCLVGSPSTVRDRMREQFAATGVTYLLCRIAFGDVPLSRSLRTVDLLRREVMPAFPAP